MKSLTIPIHTIVDGYAASAATMISVCGDKRYINKYSNMLIHELRSATSWNKMSELEDEVENMKKIMDQIKDIYVDHTNLTRVELNKLLKRDMDWDVNKCLQAGLVDEILE
jgi:ATP-dependent protease ClpP protease subunit